MTDNIMTKRKITKLQTMVDDEIIFRKQKIEHYESLKTPG